MVGVILGAVVALAGLISAIICIINYGLDSMATVIFAVIFLVGLLIIGIVESQ